MPMLGVIRETFESEGGSIKGEDDFFSVARTMPFVAIMVSEINCLERLAIHFAYL